MTTTEKKYAKLLGKLYVYKNKRWDYEKEVWLIQHSLVMVGGMKRGGWQNKGPFDYALQVLAGVDENRHDFAVSCAQFYRGQGGRYNRRTEYVPLTPENMPLVGTILEVKELET